MDSRTGVQVMVQQLLNIVAYANFATNGKGTTHKCIFHPKLQAVKALEPYRLSTMLCWLLMCRIR